MNKRENCNEGAPPGEFLLYQAEDGTTRIKCRFERDTLWLSQAGMAELFQTTKQNIAKHLKAILADGELTAEAVVSQWLTTAADGKRYFVSYYNLNAILAVGYRVRSLRGTQFRRWATAQLTEFLHKGFVMDDERLKNPESDIYFEQLLERIRDIRSSEKVFWRKVLDIYSTSIDYDPSAEASKQFFSTIQNKIHWATHGHTAAELIVQRADAGKPHMGLTHFSGIRPRRSEVAIAKNYLNAEELETLNRIVVAYLEFAELQARGRRAMTMATWIEKLDDFLKLSEHDLLTHAGRVSAEAARLKVEAEYEHYRKQLDSQPSPVELDMDKVLDAVAKTHPKRGKIK
jgi:hypothetical protein